MTNDNKAKIDEIIHFSRLGYERQLVAAAGGNVSCRCAEGLLITRSGVSLRNVTEKDILLVPLAGKKEEYSHHFSPSKEVNFHLAIYCARPSVQAIYHVHPPYITAYTVAKQGFPRVTSSAVNKLCAISQLPPMRAGSLELAHVVGETVRREDENTRAIILAQHGIITFDYNLEEAFNTAELMEDSARIAYIAEQISFVKGFTGREESQ